jgi:FAD-linked sulfhydryl oxidase
MLNVDTQHEYPRKKFIFIGAAIAIVSLLLLLNLMAQKMEADSIFYSSDVKIGSEDDKKDQKCGLEPPGLGSLTKEQVGKTTWEFMHTTVENLKLESLTEDRRKEVIDKAILMIKTTTELFPCVVCKDDFTEILKQNSFDDFVASRKELKSVKPLSHWLCYLHNKVNEKLKKKQFPCTDEELEKRWKMGSKRC